MDVGFFCGVVLDGLEFVGDVYVYVMIDVVV